MNSKKEIALLTLQAFGFMIMLLSVIYGMFMMDYFF